MGEKEIGEFITHPAKNEKVSASTQNQALCAMVFLYKNVLKKELENTISIYLTHLFQFIHNKIIHNTNICYI